MLLLERVEFVAEQAGSTVRGWQGDLNDVFVEDNDVFHLLDRTHDGFWDSSAGRYLSGASNRGTAAVLPDYINLAGAVVPPRHPVGASPPKIGRRGWALYGVTYGVSLAF